MIEVTPDPTLAPGDALRTPALLLDNASEGPMAL